MQRSEGGEGLGSAPVPEWIRPARSHGLLARLSDNLVNELAARGQRIEYPRGGVGLRWDEEPKTAIVVKGLARGFLAHPDGNQVTTRYLGPGDMTGVFAPREPRIARGIQALEPSELLLIEAARVKQLAEANPPLAWAMIEELTTILNVTQSALYVRAFGSVRQRVAIALRARASLDGPLTSGMAVIGTQSELAIAAGTVREVVATVLQIFKREGTVDVRRGRVVILDPQRLELEAGAGLPAES
jgi:CRP/FNR family cyclic AMP-dependent transcriptional regulator